MVNEERVYAELQVILLKRLCKGKGKSFGSNLNWSENQVRLKAQLLETSALYIQKEDNREGYSWNQIPLVPVLGMSQEGGLMACDNSNESKGSQG